MDLWVVDSSGFLLRRPAGHTAALAFAPAVDVADDLVAAPHPIHDVLAGHAAACAGNLVVDLGCGPGGTLVAVAAHAPEAVLVGVDLDVGRLAQAVARVASRRSVMLCADLSRPFPLPDAAADVVICHNVAELLADPGGLLAEIRRILRPGGRAVVSHTDFAGLVVHGADVALSGRVLRAYAHGLQPWMGHVDPYAARRLPGLARRAGLAVDGFHGHVATAAQLTGHARRRVEEVATAVRGQVRRGQVDLTERDVDRWWQAIVAADQAGGFTFAETALITVACRSVPDSPP